MYSYILPMYSYILPMYSYILPMYSALNPVTISKKQNKDWWPGCWYMNYSSTPLMTTFTMAKSTTYFTTNIILLLSLDPVTISKKQNKDQRWFHRFSFSTEAYSLRKYVKHWVCKSVTYILTNARTTYYFIIDSPKLILRSQWSNFLVDCIMAWPTDRDRSNFSWNTHYYTNCYTHSYTLLYTHSATLW